MAPIAALCRAVAALATALMVRVSRVQLLDRARARKLSSDCLASIIMASAKAAAKEKVSTFFSPVFFPRHASLIS